MGPRNVTSRECLAWEDLDGHRVPQCYPLGQKPASLKPLLPTSSSVAYPSFHTSIHTPHHTSVSGGQSIWSTLGTLDDRQKVILTVAFDSTAEFHGLATGIDEATRFD
jgi:hypothetical protein